MKTKLVELAKKGGGLTVVAVVILFGLLLLLLPNSNSEPRQVANAPPETSAFSLEETERRIAEALSQIDGAGRVTVVLTLKSDGLTELATDKSFSERANASDKTRDQSEENVIVGAGSSVQTPVIVRQGYPEYQGAFAVAEGAGDANVRLEITRALSSLTGLGTDRITVSKMKTP